MNVLIRVDKGVVTVVGGDYVIVHILDMDSHEYSTDAALDPMDKKDILNYIKTELNESNSIDQ